MIFVNQFFGGFDRVQLKIVREHLPYLVAYSYYVLRQGLGILPHPAIRGLDLANNSCYVDMRGIGDAATLWQGHPPDLAARGALRKE